MIAEKDIIGNRKCIRYLDKVLEKGCVCHAYLFEGPEHVGKMKVALAFAGELLGDNSGNIASNPDFIHIFPDKEERQIGVEAIRQLQKDLSLYPFKASYKVAVIEKADMMSLSSANSLLKTLEEPGATSVIILVTAEMEKVLPTIQSRCQILSFGPVFDEEIRNLLLSKKGSATEIEDILEIAQGRPGLALRLFDDREHFRRMDMDRKKVLGFFHMGDYSKMESISHIYDMEKEQAAEVLDGWIVALRSEMLKDLRKSGSEEKEHIAKIKAAIERTSSVREDIMERNVNLRLALENLVLSFK
jgi:DNA polymerase-3 subunit delta'